MTKPTRALVQCLNGAVAAPHTLATLAGLAILERGGSAVDATIAMNAALAVVYPHMTGIGGDAFWLVHDGASGRTAALNGSGPAVAGASRAAYAERGLAAIPTRGPLAAITLPGAVASWCAAHERHGRLPLADCLAPAIAHARQGVAVGEGLAAFVAQTAAVLAEDDDAAAIFLPGGRPLAAGQVLRLPALAATLEAVAREGHAGFYDGPVADELAAAVARRGGLWQRADLAGVAARWGEPVSTDYRGATILQHPPNSQGFVHLMLLNVLERFDVAGMGDASPALIHVMAEACRLVFEDRDRYLTDPDFAEIPLDRLLSKAHAAELAARIDPAAATLGVPAPVPGDTTATVAVDAEGNAVSMIQSIYHEFGAGVVAGETGVLLQNRGAFFSLDPAHPNRLEPGKRSFHTLMPGMILRDGRFEAAYGTMGGEGQPQTSTLLVLRLLDFGLDPQRAIDAPRWLYGRTWGDDVAGLRVEDRIGAETVAALARAGHAVSCTESFSDVMGHAAMIRRDATTGVLAAGADPRSEGIAAGR